MKTSLSLTQRAADDIQAIFDHSIHEWGKATAEKYLTAIQSGIDRIQADPSLLDILPDFDSNLQFYRINKHLLVCDVKSESIIVVTVIHGSMDIPTRLAELIPALSAEVEMLHQRLWRGRSPR